MENPLPWGRPFLTPEHREGHWLSPWGPLFPVAVLPLAAFAWAPRPSEPCFITHLPLPPGYDTGTEPPANLPSTPRNSSLPFAYGSDLTRYFSTKSTDPDTTLPIFAATILVQVPHIPKPLCYSWPPKRVFWLSVSPHLPQAPLPSCHPLPYYLLS